MHLSPTVTQAAVCSKAGGPVAVDSLLIVTPTMVFCNCSMFYFVLLYVHSCFAIILMWK